MTGVDYALDLRITCLKRSRKLEWAQDFLILVTTWRQHHPIFRL